MSPQKLPNYLKSRRKQIGFTQKELAYLLGSDYPLRIPQYEHFKAVPCLQAAFALAIIFGEPSKVLFSGIYEQAKEKVCKQAALLLPKVEKSLADIHREEKLALLQKLSSGQ